MAQSGYTPILIYASGTTSNTPLAANLTSTSTGAELALNYFDGKLFYKDASGNVQVLASKAGNINVSSLSFGTTGLTPSTATTGAITVAGTLITSNGGTGLSSYTAGDLPYYASGTALSKLGIGTSGQILTSSGTAPQWSTLSGVAVTTFSAGTTGFTPSSATSGAITLAGTLAVGNGGTGLTTFTANGVVYASSSSALATGSALTWSGSQLGINTSNYGTSGGPVVIYGASSNQGIAFQTGSVGGGFISNNGSGAGLNFYTNTGALGSETFTERMRINSIGNVGIGTTSPSSISANYTTLDIRGSSGSGTYMGVSGGTNTLFYTDAGGSNIFTSAAIPLQFGTNGTERMRIDSSGNLLVGTTGNLNYSSKLRVYGATNGSVAEFYTPGTNYTSRISLTNDFSGAGIGSVSGALVMYANDASTERMRIDSSGNVGIGTSSPAQKFDVAGKVNIDSSNTYGKINIARYSGGIGAYIQGTDSSGAANGLYMVYAGGNAQGIAFDGSNILFYNNSNTTERMRITSAGQIGIGITSPVSNLTIGQNSSTTAGQYNSPSTLTLWNTSAAGDIGGTISFGGAAPSTTSTAFFGSVYGGVTASDSTGTTGYIAFATKSTQSATTVTERMRIDSSGNLLIGTTTQRNSATISTTALGIGIGTGTTAGTYRQIYWDTGTGNFYFYNGTNQGYLNSAGSWTNASDARLKNSITDIKYGLDAVLKTQPRSYKMNDLDGNYIGFIAQELQEVIPEVVSGDEKQLGVDYGSLVAVAFKAIQEQQALIESLTTRLTALENK